MILGYACLYWHFSSLAAVETVLMNDLFVAPEARGRGVGRALIEASRRGRPRARRRLARVGDRPRQPHRPAPLRLDDDREIDLARVRAGRLTEAGEQFERVRPTTTAGAGALPRVRRATEVLAPVGLPADEEALAEEAPPADLAPPGGEMLLVTLDGAPVAIGGVSDLDTPVAEVKSMYVAPAPAGAASADACWDGSRRSPPSAAAARSASTPPPT